jgi:hypothetical protein
MAHRIAAESRFAIALVAFALYAFSAIFVPAAAARGDHAAHPCHMATHQTDAAGNQAIGDAGAIGTFSARHSAADHDGGALPHGALDCLLTCSMAVTTVAEQIFAPRRAGALSYAPFVQDAVGLAPRRLRRPPKFPFA